VPWQACRPHPGLIPLELAVDSPVVYFIEKLDGWGGLSERFGTYLSQHNKRIHNLFAINQVQQLLLNRIKRISGKVAYMRPLKLQASLRARDLARY